MIDPKRITNFNRSLRELEVFWLFCLMVAGKNADQTAAKVVKLAGECPEDRGLFEWLCSSPDLHNLLVAHRTGQYGRLKLAVEQSRGLDLRTCTVEDLEGVFGAGPKTARFFLLHSRPGVKVAVLDTHVLRWLREQTLLPDVPESTPPKGREYERWESIALQLMRAYFPGMSSAEADLLVWTRMSGRL